MRSKASTAKQPPSQSELAFQIVERRSHWLAKRIREHHGYDALDGMVDRDELVKRLRSAIDTFGLAAVVCGRGSDNRPITYTQAFEHTFGEKL